jgi:hypothetical protein
MKLKFFEKIILTDDPPIKRWSKFKPFDFEKGPEDTHWLPFIFGVPKVELFQCIDKDHDERGNLIYKQDQPQNKLTFYKILYNVGRFLGKPSVIYIREFLNKRITNYKRKKGFYKKNL